MAESLQALGSEAGRDEEPIGDALAEALVREVPVADDFADDVAETGADTDVPAVEELPSLAAAEVSDERDVTTGESVTGA